MEIVIVILLVIILLLIYKQNSTFDESIPKIIHQTAPADESKWNPIWKPCQESWKRNFPHYEYRMWTDEDLDNFIKTKYSWFYPTYISYPKNINRIDAARYFILYEYGGIYADMDFECLKNFEHLLPKGKACAAESPWYTSIRDGEMKEKYQNALMVSPVRHPFWEFVFKDLEENKTNPDVLHSTGPEVIHRIADSNPDIFYGLPRRHFAQQYDENFKALGYVDDVKKHMTQMNAEYDPELYTRHHGTGSWF